MYVCGSRVTLMEDDAGNVLLKNLSLHHATNDEEALNLLFMVRCDSPACCECVDVHVCVCVCVCDCNHVWR